MQATQKEFRAQQRSTWHEHECKNCQDRWECNCRSRDNSDGEHSWCSFRCWGKER